MHSLSLAFVSPPPQKVREASDLRAALSQRDDAVASLRARLDAQQLKAPWGRAEELARLSAGLAEDLATL